MDLPVVSVEEPGTTEVGREIARLVKGGSGALLPLTELFLFAAARAELVGRIIIPALEEGKIVLADRFSPSTFAYQGYGRGVDLELIRLIDEKARGGINPDLVILLDLDPLEGLARKGRGDRFEREELDFHMRVRKGFLELAAADPGRWLVVNASLPPPQIGEIIWKRVRELLREREYHAHHGRRGERKED